MDAVVIGGTGATGRELVRALLRDERFKSVNVLVRRSYFDAHPKLKEVVVDFDRLEMEDYRKYIDADVAFSCLGTTLKDAGSKDEQWKVDHDYQLRFASVAKYHNVGSFVLLSSVGANPKSMFFYARMKGVLENNIRKLDFKQLLIIQPGGIDRPNTTRKGEKLMIGVIKAFNSMGLFKSYRPIGTDRLAQAMIDSFFKYRDETVKVVSLKEIGY